MRARTRGSCLGPCRAVTSPTPAKPSLHTVVALYSYKGSELEGEISFQAGDVIEIVSKTSADDPDFWEGRYGVFPAMIAHAAGRGRNAVAHQSLAPARRLCAGGRPRLGSTARLGSSRPCSSTRRTTTTTRPLASTAPGPVAHGDTRIMRVG